MSALLRQRAQVSLHEAEVVAILLSWSTISWGQKAGECGAMHATNIFDSRTTLAPDFRRNSREQLRRAIFQEVATYVAGGRASLLLLQRERMSLVPRAITSGETEGGIVVSGIKNDVPGVGGACPREGDDSERYSRIVVAKHRY